MKEKLKALISEGKYSLARQEIVDLNYHDISEILFNDLDWENSLVVFRLLPKDVAAGVFSYLDRDQQQHIIESFSHAETSGIMDELFMDDTVDFVEEMPANVVKKVLAATDPQKRGVINQIMKYPEDSVGSIMTIEFMDLKKDMTVAQAIEKIRATGRDTETLDTCYIIDKNRVLEGEIPLRTLILSNATDIIGDIMNPRVKYLKTHEDQEEAALAFREYDFFIMPVVDEEKRLVGIVTVDDVIDILDMETTEDIQKMAAMAPSEEEYLKSSPFKLAMQRIPWLMVLMISATFTGRIIGRYENALNSMMILAAFIPMIMDTGGNSGSQSSTLIIRGLALGEIKTGDALKILAKEFAVSLIAGSLLSVLNFLRLYFFEKAGFLVSVTVSATILFTVILSKIVGAMLPIVAKKLKMDPAIMAGPLITTIVDAISLVIYFQVATMLFHL